MRRVILCVGILAVLLQVALSADVPSGGKPEFKCYSCGGKMNDCEKRKEEKTCAPGEDTCQYSWRKISGFDPSDYKSSDLGMTPDGNRVYERLCATAKACADKKKKTSKLYTVECCKNPLCN
ncbi:uncharacterized protein O3C94_022570 [Discoglossus pictus]